MWIIWRGEYDWMAFAGVQIAAILFAMATIVRTLGIVLPIFAALPPLLLPRLSWRRSICVALLAFTVPSLAAFAWIVRNAQQTGVWILSTDGPIDLFYYKAAGVRWYRGDTSYPAVQDELSRELGWPMQRLTRCAAVTAARDDPSRIEDHTWRSCRVCKHDTSLLR